MQKRKAERTKFILPIEFKLIPAKQGVRRASILAMHEAWGIDISSRGLGLTTEYALVRGTVLRLVFPAAKGADVPVLAEVAWSDPAEGSHRAGLRFLQ